MNHTATISTEDVLDRIAFCEAKAREGAGEPVERYWRQEADKARDEIARRAVAAMRDRRDAYARHDHEAYAAATRRLEATGWSPAMAVEAERQMRHAGDPS